tara:strand:- start:14027 stop:14311 length:285 start_codon:yes stop_codon:yes gene_type:complete
MDDEFEERRGPGVKWQMLARRGTQVISGYTVDNLDKKTIEEADSRFELIFIESRRVLQQCASMCLDNEYERLNVCQKLARALDRSLGRRQNNDK